MNTPSSPNVPRTYWPDIIAIALLVWSAWLLGGAGEYHRYSYYEQLRSVVCVAWAITAWRFFVLRWFPVAVLGVLIAWLFNPIIPVRMSKWEWQPYDHWTMLLSVAAAITLATLAIARYRQLPPSTSSGPSV